VLVATPTGRRRDSRPTRRRALQVISPRSDGLNGIRFGDPRPRVSNQQDTMPIWQLCVVAAQDRDKVRQLHHYRLVRPLMLAN
jgi:hypothetical protein